MCDARRRTVPDTSVPRHPTGREVSPQVIAHFQFDDEGRIKQETACYDSLTFLRALGVKPPG